MQVLMANSIAKNVGNENRKTVLLINTYYRKIEI